MRGTMMTLLLVEDNANFRPALAAGLEATGAVQVAHGCASGEAALAYCLAGAAEGRRCPRWR